MSQINPFTWVAQQGQVQQKQATTSERRIRRVQNLARDAALNGDHLEHQVESADAIRRAEDHDPNLPERQRAKRPNDPNVHDDDPELPKLDIRA